MFLLVVLELPCLHTRGGSVDQCGDKRRLAGPFTALPLPILPIEHSSSQVMHTMHRVFGKYCLIRRSRKCSEL